MSAPQPAAPAPIAIIGIGCRYPGGADNPDAFWQMIRSGTDSITEVPTTRWDPAPIYDPDPSTPNKTNTRWGGFLSQVDEFDPQFFGIAPREVATMDPQQRLLLEVTWEALEDAGQIPDTLRGSKTGVFIGIGTHDYSIMLWQQPVNDPYATTGTGNCIAANRLSYLFDLKGPSLAVDTACSSSLVAMHLACQSLWTKESAMAIAGGVNVLLLPTVTAGFSKGGFMSGDGRCKSFDASADGYVRSEGAGIVLLKPLAQALKDGDPVYAVIRGSAVNQDGFSQGMAAPNPQAQEAVLRNAYRLAQVNPAQVKYIEAHGTGTKLGDPIEAQALGAVLAEGRSHTNPCLIGSVKTNIGHTETAAGIAGIIKAALMLKHRELPPSVHFHKPNPAIDFESLRLQVQRDLAPLPASPTTPTYIGINSFGFGGTNAHIVLSDTVSSDTAPSDTAPSEIEQQQIHPESVKPSTSILTLSAKSETALKAVVQSYLTLLKENPNVNLAALCVAANTKRSHFTHRLALIAQSTQQLITQLQDHLAENEDTIGLLSGQVRSTHTPEIAFLCTGQGSQFTGMGCELYETQPIFRNTLKRCAEILQDSDINLLEILFSETNTTDIHQTRYTQPVLFAFEYALAQLWKSWGIQPSIVLGHSLGEYVAACLAGVFSPQDALKLVTARGQLMQALPTSGDQAGAMVSVMADVATCEALMAPFGEEVSIAAINGPQSTVISGKKGAIAHITTQLETQAIKCKPLQVSHAFHSALMDPMLQAFREVAQSITYHKPTLPIISLLTGRVANSDTATSNITTADYWVQHVRSPVQFLHAINTLQQHLTHTYLEIGAKPLLLGMARACLPTQNNNIQWLASLRPSQPDTTAMLTSLAHLHTQNNTSINWANITPTVKPTSLSLPTYPFQRQRYWWEEAEIPSMTPLAERQLSSAPAAPNTGHALLGSTIPLAGATEKRFQNSLSPQSPQFLSDHRILDQVILPGAAYVEMAIAAAAEWKTTTSLSLSNVTIEQALNLSTENTTPIQLVLTPEENNQATLKIFSLNSTDDTFTRHATAVVSSSTANKAPETELSQVQIALLAHPVNVSEYYETLRSQNLNYGPSFRTIRQLWQKDGQSLSQIRTHHTTTTYHLHPTLLDGCLQTIGAAIQADTASSTYLPVGLDQLQFYEPLQQSGWCHVQLHPANSQNGHTSKQLKADLSIWTENGTLAAQITGMTLQQVSHATLQKLFSQSASPTETASDTPPENWLHHLTWEPQAHSVTDSTQKTEQSPWLIFSTTDSTSNSIETQLIAAEESIFRIHPGSTYQTNPDSSTYTLNPSSSKDFNQLFSDLIPTLIAQQSENLSCRIVYLWGLGNKTNAPGDLTNQQQNCGALLHLVQALAQCPALKAQLWVITQSAQTIDTPAPLQLHQTPLWGLTRSLRLEQPSLNCTAIDLPASDLPASDLPASDLPTSTEPLTPETLNLLLTDLQQPTPEQQISYRQNNRFVARLSPHTETSQLPIPSTDSFRLGLSSYGVLDHLTLVPADRTAPGPNEIEIQVKASGLNFRDVLNALGMLQSVLEQMGFASAEYVPFGGECAGIVTAIGPDVTTYKVGDAVIAAQAVGSLRAFITVSTDFVVPKPANMSFAEAATVPTTFLTAYYGLVHCAQLKAGDRILIHSAAGGVGQAAVQIAQHIGAEIFATASQPKWSFLKSLGIPHIMNSRTLDFASEIQTTTAGKGVDVIFNSLNGDFISKSVEVLAPQGRFVEIGKIGIWDTEKMHATRPDISYYPFDLLQVSQANPQLIVTLLNKLIAQFTARTLTPLPKTVFPITAAPDAFRYMAQARHIGKVVLTLPPIAPQQSLIDPAATYLITGGLGALGLHLAKWLTSQGAKNLLLIGRSAPSPTAQQTLTQLKEQDISVTVIQADISDRTTLKTALTPYISGAERSRSPLKGIFHLAGTLKDSLLTNQTWENFATVMQPKITGAWNLHTLTQSCPLDHFICFSSIVSLMGSLGQTNYAAANAFLDGLMHHRQALGLPGLSLNWGPWANVGMVAQLDPRSQIRMSEQGLTPIPPNLGLQLMADLMQQSQPQVGVIPIDWATFMASASGQANGARTTLFEKVKPAVVQVNVAAQTGILRSLAKSDESDRPNLLATYLQQQLAKVMGFGEPEAINPNEQFGDLGMDSLMAVEFSNRLQTNLSHPIPQTLAFDYPTVNALAKYLVEQIALPTIDEKSESTDQPVTEPSIPTEKVPTEKVMVATENDRTPKESLKTEIRQPTTTAPKKTLLATPTYTPPAEHYQFSQMTDYLRLRQDLDRVEDLGNPFFTVHDGTAKDTTTIQGRSLINYASYNYLGLSGDPRITQAAQTAIAQYGTSVSASRVVSGERPVHQQLEHAITRFLRTPDCIAYIGGHATNVTTIGHLFQTKDLILYDALSHNSIREGCNLSGATAIEFPHNNWQTLNALLHEHRAHYEKVLIAIEGVYSTDGDIAPLPEFIQIKTAHKAFLLVDEAHSIGVLGDRGHGIGEHYGIDPNAVDLWMGTLSKSFASCGGYIAGCAELIEYLKYTAPGFVFSVGMAPANAAAALAALQVIEQEPERVTQVQARANLFLTLAKENGLNTGTSNGSPVIPIIVGEPYKAVQLSHTLFQQGINVQPMVYPSVPYDAARLRFFISSLHSEEQIRQTVQTITDELMILNMVASS
ncbi:MAG: aminotransferase class I/II-fold pyridoxal phosphate-dependent enzyme [Cyanobacteria bacterium J06598_3]